MGAILACLPTKEGRLSFREGIRKVIKGGGCNCSRANLAGALLGSSLGIYDDLKILKESDLEANDRGIPISWILKTDKIEEILQLSLNCVNNEPC